MTEKHCNCGCNHDHVDHDDICCADASHGGHNSQADALAKSALQISRREEIKLSQPVPADSLIRHSYDCLCQIAQRLSLQGVVLGHIKALLEFETGSQSLSITRLDEGNQDFFGWNGCNITSYRLTVNIISLYNTDAVLDDLLDSLITPPESHN